MDEAFSFIQTTENREITIWREVCCPTPHPCRQKTPSQLQKIGRR